MAYRTPLTDRSGLLSRVLEAQQRAADQLSAAHLSGTAERLVDLAQSMNFPLLLPVSREAERLVGAALLVGGGQVSAADASTVLTGKRVLLVDTVVVRMAAVATAAYIAKQAGAAVMGAAVLDQLGEDVAPGLAIHSLTHS
jgi:hypothetical protein